MKKSAVSESDSERKKPVTKPTSPFEQAPWVMREIADTTWRMTVPVVIFTFIGIFFDLKLGSAPWLTFLGVVVGFYFAVVLIKQQIKRSEDR